MVDVAEWQLARYAEAAGRHGVFDRAQAWEVGLEPEQVMRRVAAGRFVEEQPGVYRFAGVPRTRWLRRRAATLGTGRRAAVSHRDAADVHGLDRAAGAAIEITVAGSGPLERWDVTVHRSREPCRDDVTVVDGVAVTTGERTVIDLARLLDPLERTALVDDAIGVGAARRARLHARARALAAGRRGVGTVAAVTAPGAEGELRSWLERTASLRLAGSDLPAPTWNVPIHRGGQLLGVIDAFWEAVPLGLDLDGLRFHRTPEQRRADVRRDRRILVDAGIPILRADYHDVVHRWPELLGQLGRALGRAGVGRCPHGPPPDPDPATA